LGRSPTDFIDGGTADAEPRRDVQGGPERDL